MLITLAFEISGCSTQVLKPEQLPEASGPAQFEDYYDRWIFGLIGDSRVDPEKICFDQVPVKIREFTSFEDILLGVLTVGIYLPETVQVWCVDKRE